MSSHRSRSHLTQFRTQVLVQRFSSKAPISLSHASLVPGDIVVLSSGDLVPADCVLLTSHALTVSQSALTGEVMPVDKSAEADQDKKEKDQEDYEEGGAVIQMKNVLIAGSSISTGDCTALVVTTGDRESNSRQMGGHVLTESLCRYLRRFDREDDGGPSTDQRLRVEHPQGLVPAARIHERHDPSRLRHPRDCQQECWMDRE